MIQWLHFICQNHPSYSDIVIDHDAIKSLWNLDNESDIYHHLPIHILTAESEKMIEEESKVAENDEISGSLNFGP